jgi:hypothetical protein
MYHPENTVHRGTTIIIKPSLQFTLGPITYYDCLQAAIVNIDLNRVDW